MQLRLSWWFYCLIFTSTKIRKYQTILISMQPFYCTWFLVLQGLCKPHVCWPEVFFPWVWKIPKKRLHLAFLFPRHRNCFKHHDTCNQGSMKRAKITKKKVVGSLHDASHSIRILIDWITRTIHHHFFPALTLTALTKFSVRWLENLIFFLPPFPDDYLCFYGSLRDTSCSRSGFVRGSHSIQRGCYQR